MIVKKDCGVWLHNDTVLRLQVDDNPEPIKELKRIVGSGTSGAPFGHAGMQMSSKF